MASNHDNAYQNLVDYQDPRPHFQEVYDYQLRTGLMDNLATTAIFAVAAFDGEGGVIDSGTGQVRPENYPASQQPYIDDAIDDGGTPGGLTPETNEDYNLGVYKITGPMRLDVPSTQLNGLSSYAQYAVNDIGFMRNDNRDEFVIDPENNNSRVEYTFPSGLEKYVTPYRLGHQPVAGATPLAAAMRDIHMYMLNGQAKFDEWGTGRVPRS